MLSQNTKPRSRQRGAGIMIPVIILIMVMTLILASFLSREMSKQEMQRTQTTRSQLEIAATSIADRLRVLLGQEFDAYMITGAGASTGLGTWETAGWLRDELKPKIESELKVAQQGLRVRIVCTEDINQECTRDRMKEPKRLAIDLTMTSREGARLTIQDVVMLGRPNFTQFAMMLGGIDWSYQISGLQLNGPLAVNISPMPGVQLNFRNSVSNIDKLYLSGTMTNQVSSVVNGVDFLNVRNGVIENYNVRSAFQTLQSGIQNQISDATLTSSPGALDWTVEFFQNASGEESFRIIESRYIDDFSAYREHVAEAATAAAAAEQ